MTKEFIRNISAVFAEKMIDMHCHIWLDKHHKTRPLKEGRLAHGDLAESGGKGHSVEDLQETYRLMFPDKEVTPLMFASTKRETLEVCNAYVQDAAARTGYPALYYSDPEEDADTLEKHIRDGGFMGVKSYLDLSPSYLPEAEIRIFDFFPKEQLRRLDRMGAIVMLHIRGTAG